MGWICNANVMNLNEQSVIVPTNNGRQNTWHSIGETQTSWATHNVDQVLLTARDSDGSTQIHIRWDCRKREFGLAKSYNLLHCEIWFRCLSQTRTTPHKTELSSTPSTVWGILLSAAVRQTSSFHHHTTHFLIGHLLSRHDTTRRAVAFVTTK